MKRIPDVLLSCNSNAERKVFELLGAVDLGPQWCAFHSLNCSEHEYKRWAELDFVVIGPEGVFVLEVKGGRISVEDGLWTYTDRFQKRHISTEGPFVQARTGMHALERILSTRYQLEPLFKRGTVFGFGVVFPDITWNVSTPEMPREVVADARQVASAEAFAKYLSKLKNYWLSKIRKPMDLGPDDLRRVRACIRPDVDVYPAFGVRLGQAMQEMVRLTTEQYERLEIIEHNQRAVVHGGAGTGKTFLMMQCARRECAMGNSVLVVVESSVMAAHLRTLDSSRGLGITSFDALPLADYEADVLLVDEGQDLTNLDAIARISENVKGGIDNGRWRWFMDHNNQASVAGRYEPEALEYLLEGLPTGPPARVPLVKNVRNTREIAQWVQWSTGADLGRSEVTGYGTPPRIVTYDDETDLALKVGDALQGLLDEDTEPGDIGLILASELERAFLQRLPSRLRRKCVPLDSNTVRARMRGRIVTGRASGFKGLERPVVLAVGFADLAYAREKINELYVAVTRANYCMLLFTSTPVARMLSKNADRNRRAVTETPV